MLIRSFIFLPTLIVLIAVASVAPTRAADDWSFITPGKYAVSLNDCKLLAKGRPFSKALVKDLESEVMTREGITSQRETHCKFRSSQRQTGGKTGWVVKAACEEMGSVSQENIAIEKNADGALIVTSEEVFGPALTFLLCPK